MASWDCTLQSPPWGCPGGCLLPKVDQMTCRDWSQPAPMDLGKEAPQRVPSYTVADGDCKWDLHFLWNLSSWKPWTSLRTGKVLVQQAKLPNLKYQHTGHAKGVRWGWKLPQVNSSWEGEGGEVSSLSSFQQICSQAFIFTSVEWVTEGTLQSLQLCSSMTINPTPGLPKGCVRSQTQ